MREKSGIVRYVNIVKKLFIVFSAVVIPVFFICLVFTFMRFAAFYILTPAVAVLYFVVYGFYAMRVSMGTVLGAELTDEVIHLYTKRKTFTYGRNGCVAVRETKNKFVCTFRTNDSEDKFIFYRRVLFSPYYAEQFTREEIKLIYPAYNAETDGANA